MQKVLIKTYLEGDALLSLGPSPATDSAHWECVSETLLSDATNWQQ